jgi:hypothetical protein
MDAYRDAPVPRGGIRKVFDNNGSSDMRVSDEVLKVLSEAQLAGNSLKLQGQLDRAMYLSVNKVLEATGWTWNRKAKAHLCEGDAVEVLERVLLTGEVTIAKNEFDDFPTPELLAAQLVEWAYIEPDMKVLEPNGGSGRIVKAALAAGALVWSYEIQEAHAKKLDALLYPSGSCIRKDFMTVEPVETFDAVAMNPPFSRQQDIKHVMHAYKFLKPGGHMAAIMSAGVLFRTDRLTTSFRQLVEDCSGVIEQLPDASFKESGTMVRTVVARFSKHA